MPAYFKTVFLLVMAITCVHLGDLITYSCMMSQNCLTKLMYAANGIASTSMLSSVAKCFITENYV